MSIEESEAERGRGGAEGDHGDGVAGVCGVAVGAEVVVELPGGWVAGEAKGSGKPFEWP